MDTRNNIINTAAHLFYNRGYNLTGINEIIAESGIAKATLYSHFKSKEDLFIAYLEMKDDNFLRELTTYCNKKPKGNRRLIAILDFLIEFFNEEDFNGCWCIRSIAEVPKENKKIRDIIKNNKLKFKDFVNHLVLDNRGDLRSKKVEKLTNELYLLYEAAVTESHIHSAEWPIKAAISLFKDRLKFY